LESWISLSRYISCWCICPIKAKCSKN